MRRTGHTEREAPQMPQQRLSATAHDGLPDQDLTLVEAAGLYEVSLRTLRQRVTVGSITARKVTGVRGPEWRVTGSALKDAGYTPRIIDLTGTETSSSEVRRLTDALAAERARSSDLDQRLGYALLTVGRLRGRLREAGIDPDGLFGGDLQGLPADSRARRPSSVRSPGQ